jgi:hypothetical protein
VCLHDGYGEATGTLDGGGPVDAAFRLKGTVALDGNHPEARIRDIDLGKVPGIALALWEGEAEDPINDALDQVELAHTYTVAYFEGGVRIDGQPEQRQRRVCRRSCREQRECSGDAGALSLHARGERWRTASRRGQDPCINCARAANHQPLSSANRVASSGSRSRTTLL